MTSHNSVLDTIVESVRERLEHRKRELPQPLLEERVNKMAPPLNFSGALWGYGIRLIAEVKRASPSRGVLRPDLDPVALARTYAENGAAAISVLTEEKHFQGSLAYLRAVKETMQPYKIPVLRKDFIFDPYQVYEARDCGADAILLIVAILTPERLKELLALSNKLWLQCLVEVHSEPELRVALDAGAEVIGINNRDLHTFKTDISLTERLAPLVPKGKVVVSESGIKSRQDVLALQRVGVHAVLVGEALVTASDVAAKVRELARTP